MAEDQHGGFLGFPLYLLARQGDFAAIVTECIDIGIARYISAAEETPSFLIGWRSWARERKDYAYEGARKTIGFAGGTFDSTIEVAGRADALLKSRVALWGPSPLVRLPIAWLFKAREGDGIGEKELRVLAAIASVIGAKEYAKIGWPMLQGRAAGYKAPLTTNSVPEDLRGPLYSRFQIARIVDALRARKFFARAVYRQGESFYSQRLQIDELWAMIEKRKLRTINADDRARNTTWSERIHSAQAAAEKGVHDAGP